DAVVAGGGDDGADQVAGVGRRVLVDSGQGHVAAVVEERCVVDRGDGDRGGLGGGAEGGTAAVGGHVRGGAIGPIGLVPGAEGDTRVYRADEVGVGDEVDAGAGVGGQQPGGGVRRAVEGGPVGASVGAVLPGAVAVVNGKDGDALDGGVGVGDAV